MLGHAPLVFLTCLLFSGIATAENPESSDILSHDEALRSAREDARHYKLILSDRFLEPWPPYSRGKRSADAAESWPPYSRGKRSADASEPWPPYYWRGKRSTDAAEPWPPYYWRGKRSADSSEPWPPYSRGKRSTDSLESWPPYYWRGKRSTDSSESWPPYSRGKRSMDASEPWPPYYWRGKRSTDSSELWPPYSRGKRSTDSSESWPPYYWRGKRSTDAAEPWPPYYWRGKRSADAAEPWPPYYWRGKRSTDISQPSSRRKRSLDLDVTDLDENPRKFPDDVMKIPICILCEAGVNLIQYHIATGKKTPDITRMLYTLCVGTKYKPPKYCEELTNLIAPEVVEILSNTTNSPMEVCSFIFNKDCGNGDVPHHRWSVQLPAIPKPKMKPRTPPKPTTPKFKVLHLTDTHYDPLYQEGTRDVCELPMCCRASNGIAEKNESSAGKWGGWKCDIPERTLDNLLQHLNDTHAPFDYIIWTGDIPPHASWSQTVEESIALLNSTVAKVLKYFPNTPVFPALGNHEASPPHNFAPPVLNNQQTISWLYDALQREWSYFLPENTYDTIKYAGFYSATVRPGLKIVSLNTNFCYFNNWWLILNSTDPADMLKWFVQELQDSEDKNEKIHVIAHIPPGYIDCLKIWSQNYYKIISRYEATVTAQFFGHTHTDEIELFYRTEDNKKPAAVAYVGPSASTFTYLNPGYRIYSIDGHHSESQYFVYDYETWIMNLTQANLYDNPVWYKLYSAKADYRLSSLLPEEWHKFYENLKVNDGLLETYDRNYWKDSIKRPKCDAKCKRTRLCDIRSCIHYGDPFYPRSNSTKV